MLTLAISIAILIGHLSHLVQAEEDSILNLATTDPSQFDTSTPDGDIFINGSFKSYFKSLSNT